MRAHVLTRFGKTNAVLDLRDIPPPPLAPEQLRVDVQAVALNPVDLKIREGEPKILLPLAPPFVFGVDLVGVVTEVGSAVTEHQVGDQVFAYTGMDRMGAFAESVVLPAVRAATSPANMSAEQAACLPLPGLCALQALDGGQVARGARVLIHGGAGAVGSLAVQVASRRGAEVYATASARDHDRLRALGVAHPIDYRSQRFEDLARDVDFVFDTVGGDTLKRSWSVIKRGGGVASLHVPPPADALVAAGLRAPRLLRALLPLVTRGPRRAAERAGARLTPILTVPSAADLRRLTSIAEHLAIQVSIDRVFAFEELHAAIDRLISGQATGRVVLKVAR